MKLKLVFSGGSEVLFNHKREHEVEVPAAEGTQVRQLLAWINDNLIVDKTRAELLLANGGVRPGILVLVNDTDYEITGGLNTTLNDNDEVMFISTLHGG